MKKKYTLNILMSQSLTKVVYLNFIIIETITWLL